MGIRLFSTRQFSALGLMRLCVLGMLLCVLALVQCGEAPEADGDSGWIQLFNGKDLEGWTPKIRGYDLGDNYGNTFRVVNGVMQISYDQYTLYEEKFGHIFYKDPYSHYRLRVEYRFIGEQCPGGPGWAFRNNGIMLHCQDPATMTRDQSFPVSIEAQLPR